MKTIRFTEKQPPYMAGDVAGFEDDVADRYIAEGVAESIEPVADDDPGATEQPRRRRQRRRETV